MQHSGAVCIGAQSDEHLIELFYDESTKLGQNVTKRLSNEKCHDYHEQFIMMWFVTIISILLTLGEVYLAFYYRKNLKTQEAKDHEGWVGDAALRIFRFNIKDVTGKILGFLEIFFHTLVFNFLTVVCCFVCKGKIRNEEANRNVIERLHSAKNKKERLSIRQIAIAKGFATSTAIKSEEKFSGVEKASELRVDDMRHKSSLKLKRKDEITGQLGSGNGELREYLVTESAYKTNYFLYFIRKLFCSSVTFEIISQILDCAYIGSIQGLVNIMGDCQNYEIAKHLSRSPIFYNIFLLCSILEFLFFWWGCTTPDVGRLYTRTYPFLYLPLPILRGHIF